MNNIPFIFLIAVLLSFSCTREISRKNDVLKIEFGHGGGFSGVVKSYVLNFKQNTIVESGSGQFYRVSRKEVSEIAEYLMKYNIQDIDFNAPYNHYTFINVTSIGGQHNLVWGDTSNSPPIEVLELYDLLNNLSRKYL